jgi:hypothetical protein
MAIRVRAIKITHIDPSGIKLPSRLRGIHDTPSKTTNAPNDKNIACFVVLFLFITSPIILNIFLFYFVAELYTNAKIALCQ